MIISLLSYILSAYAVYSIIERGGKEKELVIFKLVWYMIWMILNGNNPVVSNSISYLIITFVILIASYAVSSFIECKVYDKTKDFWGFLALTAIVEFVVSYAFNYILEIVIRMI